MSKQFYVSLLSLVIASLLLVGCATMQSLDVNQRSRTYDADYTTTLKAALDYLSADGWQVATVDKDLGIINTEFKNASALSAMLTGEERYKINFSVQKVSSTQTKIIANMTYQRKTGGNAFKEGEWTEANMTEGEAADKYKEILDGIQSKIIK